MLRSCLEPQSPFSFVELGNIHPSWAFQLFLNVSKYPCLILLYVGLPAMPVLDELLIEILYKVYQIFIIVHPDVFNMYHNTYHIGEH